MAIGESGAGAVDCEFEELVLRVNDHPEVRHLADDGFRVVWNLNELQAG